MSRALSEQEVRDKLRTLEGLEIALTWKGYGSAIFLELGRLSGSETTRGRRDHGEACVMIHWDWRVESDTAVLFGSSNSGPKIEAGIRRLHGTRLESNLVTGRVPDVVGYFSNGLCLRSFAAVTGNAHWAIKLPSGSWLSARSGALSLDAEHEPMSDEELAEAELSRDTSSRWGVPKADPAEGPCRACEWFRFLDASFELSDYGICVASDSPFDGRAVHVRSGCPVFSNFEARDAD